MSFRNSVIGLVAMVFVGGLMIGGCGGKDSPTGPTVTPPSPPPPPPPSVASIVVNPSTASLEVGGTQRFTASARASDGSTISGVDIIWTSSNTAVVSITAAGLARGVSAGTATIRATGNGIASAPAAITVTLPPVANVSVSPSSAQEMTVGDTLSFTATARAANGTERDDVSITWTSSDVGVVSITSAGVATAVSAGMATIQATADGVSSSPVAVTVVEPPPPPPMVATVTVSPPMAEIEEGQTQQYEAMAMSDDGMAIPNVMITWMSSDDGVATIDADGLATGVSAGEVTITAMAGEVSGSAMLTVTEPPPPPPPVVATVSVSPSMASIEEGGMQQFEAMAMTEDGMVIPDAMITWMSSDDGVATIDADGLATGVSAGDVTITATADGIPGTATLTVMEPPPPPPVVATVTVTPPMAEIEEGKTQQFFAVAADVGGMLIQGAPITWTSSDENVATVSNTGLATGVGPGEAMITATSGDVSGEATMTVTEAPLELARIEVSPSMAELEEGQTEQFTARGLTSDNEEIPDLDFTWSSSNTNVATIDADGLATAVNAGSAQIRAMAEGITGSGSLTVTAPPLPSRSGMFGGAGGYRAAGTATLEETSSGGLVLKFGSNFQINGAGFDVILYTQSRIKLLGSSAAPVDSYVNLGDMKSRMGAQEYMVPANVQLDTYNFVLIYCHFAIREVAVAELGP